MQPEQRSMAMNELLPSLTGAAPQAIINALRSTNRIIQSRVENNQGLSSGDEASDQYMWVRGFGNAGRQDNRDDVFGYKSDSSGVVWGADAPLSSNLRAGGAFIYARSLIKGNSDTAREQVDVDTYELVGYASYNLDPVTDINYQIDIGQNRATSQRSSLGRTAQGNFDSLTAHASMGIGRTYKIDQATAMTPSVRLDYTHMRTNAYAETGALGNLQVNENIYREFVITGDVKFNHQINSSLKLVGNAGIGYDFLNKQAQTTAAFTGGGPAFVTNGLEVSPWLMRAGVGLIKNDQKGTEYSLRYDVEGRTSGYINQTLAARVRWAF